MLGSGVAAGQSPPEPGVRIVRHPALSQNVWPGDFNGDGKTDLAASDQSSFDGGTGRVLVVIGDGKGAYGAPIDTSFVGRVLGTGDFNNDRKSDLIVETDQRTNVSILPGNGNGTFGEAVSVFSHSDLTFGVSSDLDGDGNRDLVVAYEPSTALVFPGRGDLTFDTPVTLTTGDFPIDAILADINGDRKKDLVVANAFSQFVSVFLNQGAFLFTATDVAMDSGPTDVTVGDMNADGKADLIVSTAHGGPSGVDYDEGHVEIFAGHGDGTFGAPANVPVAPGAWQVVVGDFNRDRIPDVATANRSSRYIDDCGGITLKTWDSLSVIAGNGNGTFRPAASFSLGNQSDQEDVRFKNRVVSLNTNDVNADGATDLIASHGAIVFNVPAGDNLPPTVTAPDQRLDVTHETVLSAAGADADEDMLSFTWTDSAGHVFARWPHTCYTDLHDGENLLTVTVDDGHGHQTSHTVTVTVVPPPRDATIMIAAPREGEVITAGTPYTVKWTIDDPDLQSRQASVEYSLDDGSHFTLVPGCEAIPEPHAPGTPTTRQEQCTWQNPGPPTTHAQILVATTTDNGSPVAVTSVRLVIQPASSGPLPSPWQSADVGDVGAAGDASFANGVFTVEGSGADVFGTADAFQYAYQHFNAGTGDVDLVTHVDSVENVDRWTRAGLMVRDSLDAGARHASIFVTPGKGIAFQRRPTTDGPSVNTSGPLLTAPVWLRLSLRGNVAVAYYKVNANDAWIRVGDQPFTGSAPDANAGLAVVSKVDGTLATGTFSNVSITPFAPEFTTTLVGSTIGSGTSDDEDGTVTLTNRGADIRGTTDEFTFMSSPWYGDGALAVQVESVENTDPGAKAGVMFRTTREVDSPFVALFVTPGRGVTMRYRSAEGANSGQVAQITGLTAPIHLRVTRAGNLFTGEWSSDGRNWTRVGRITMPLDRDVYVGLALTSRNASATATAQFRDLTLTR